MKKIASILVLVFLFTGVVSAENVIEGFENGLTAYGGDTTAAEADGSSPVYEGNNSLKLSASSTYNEIRTVDKNFSQGENVTFDVYLDTSGNINFAFGVQAEGNRDNQYYANIEQMENQIHLRKRSGGSETQISTTDVSLSTETHYLGRVNWYENDTIAFHVEDENGNLLAQTSVEDTSFSSGGFGFGLYSGGDAVVTFDDVRNVSGQSTSSESLSLNISSPSNGTQVFDEDHLVNISYDVSGASSVKYHTEPTFTPAGEQINYTSSSSPQPVLAFPGNKTTNVTIYASNSTHTVSDSVSFRNGDSDFRVCTIADPTLADTSDYVEREENHVLDTIQAANGCDFFQVIGDISRFASGHSNAGDEGQFKRIQEIYNKSTSPYLRPDRILFINGNHDYDEELPSDDPTCSGCTGLNNYTEYLHRQYINPSADLYEGGDGDYKNSLSYSVTVGNIVLMNVNGDTPIYNTYGGEDFRTDGFTQYADYENSTEYFKHTVGGLSDSHILFSQSHLPLWNTTGGEYIESCVGANKDSGCGRGSWNWDMDYLRDKVGQTGYSGAYQDYAENYMLDISAAGHIHGQNGSNMREYIKKYSGTNNFLVAQETKDPNDDQLSMVYEFSEGSSQLSARYRETDANSLSGAWGSNGDFYEYNQWYNFSLENNFTFDNNGYSLVDLPSDVDVVERYGFRKNAEDGTRVGSHRLLASKSGEYVTEFSLNFSKGDFNFSKPSIAVDRSSAKSVFKDSSNQLNDKYLFVPRVDDTGQVRICPDAASLNEVSIDCINGENLSVGVTSNNYNLSKVNVEGSSYYKVEGVSGTGAMETSSTSSDSSTSYSSEIIEGFEGGIGNYSGATSVAEATENTPVYEGSKSLKVNASSNYNEIRTTDINLSSGGNYTFDSYLKDIGTIQFVFGAQAESNRDNQYAANIEVNSDQLHLRKRSGGSGEILSTTDVSLSNSAKYKGRLEWYGNGTIIFEVYDGGGNFVEDTSANDTEFSSGGIGFGIYSGSSGTAVYDNVTEIVEVEEDTTVPSITVYSPQNTTYDTGSVDFLNVTSSEAVETWEYSLDGSANTTFTPNTTLSGLSDGGHTVDVYATDSSGNTGSESVTFTVDTTDSTPPTSSDNWTSTGFVDKTEANPELSCSDSGSGCDYLKYRIDGGAWNQVDNPPVTLNLTNGNFTVEYYAVDNDGNNESINTVNVAVADVQETVFDLQQNTSKESDTDTQYLFKNKELSNPVSQSVTGLSFSTPSVPGNCQNCGSKQVDFQADESKNITARTQGDWIAGEKAYGLNKASSAVEYGAFQSNYSTSQMIEARNDNSDLDLSVKLDPTIPSNTECSVSSNTEVGIASGATENHSITKNCDPADEQDYSLTKSISDNVSSYEYNGTVEVYSNRSSEVEHEYWAKKSRFTDFSNRNTSSVNYSIDGVTEGLDVSVKSRDGSDYLVWTAYTNRTNSSIHEGTHYFTYEYSVDDSSSDDGSGGGSVGGGGSSGGDQDQVTESPHDWSVTLVDSEFVGVFKPSVRPGGSFEKEIVVESDESDLEIDVGCESEDDACEWVSPDISTINFEDAGQTVVTIRGQVPENADKSTYRFNIAFTDPAHEEGSSVGKNTVRFVVSTDSPWDFVFEYWNNLTGTYNGVPIAFFGFFISMIFFVPAWALGRLEKYPKIVPTMAVLIFLITVGVI